MSLRLLGMFPLLQKRMKSKNGKFEGKKILVFGNPRIQRLKWNLKWFIFMFKFGYKAIKHLDIPLIDTTCSVTNMKARRKSFYKLVNGTRFAFSQEMNFKQNINYKKVNCSMTYRIMWRNQQSLIWTGFFTPTNKTRTVKSCSFETLNWTKESTDAYPETTWKTQLFYISPAFCICFENIFLRQPRSEITIWSYHNIYKRYKHAIWWW